MTYNFDEVIEREGTHAIKYDLRGELYNSEEAYPMWVADMEFKSPPEVVEALTERAKHGIYGYTKFPETYYDSIINWHKNVHGASLQKDGFVFAPGVVEALCFAIEAYTKQGDEIIIQTPVYFPFFTTIQRNRRKVAYNHLVLKDNRYYIDFDDLEAKAKAGAKMMFFCSPHNPGGRVWSYEEVERVMQICKKYNVVLLSDEIHSDLTLYDNKHTPALNIEGDYSDILINTSSATKTFNMAGLTTAYFYIEGEGLRRELQKFLFNLNIKFGNVFGIMATETAYAKGYDWMLQLKKYLEGNIDYVMDFFKENLPEITPMRPEASYLLWFDCSKLSIPAKELNQFFAQKANIIFSDGASFGAGGENFQRMNLACPRKKLEEVLAQMVKALRG